MLTLLLGCTTNYSAPVAWARAEAPAVLPRPTAPLHTDAECAGDPHWAPDGLIYASAQEVAVSPGGSRVLAVHVCGANGHLLASLPLNDELELVGEHAWMKGEKLHHLRWDPWSEVLAVQTAPPLAYGKFRSSRVRLWHWASDEINDVEGIKGFQWRQDARTLLVWDRSQFRLIDNHAQPILTIGGCRTLGRPDGVSLQGDLIVGYGCVGPDVRLVNSSGVELALVDRDLFGDAVPVAAPDGSRLATGNILVDATGQIAAELPNVERVRWDAGSQFLVSVSETECLPWTWDGAFLGSRSANSCRGP